MEYLDIVDELGNPTGEIVERAIAHEKGIRHRTSHVWLLRKKDDKIEILILIVMIFRVLDTYQQELHMKIQL